MSPLRRNTLFAAAYLLLATAAAMTAANDPWTETHWWWKLNAEEQIQYFEEGRAAQRKGWEMSRVEFGIKPASTIDSDVTLENVSLQAPPYALRLYGWVAEKQMSSDDAAAAIRADCYRIASSNVQFEIYLTSDDHLDWLDAVSFALEVPAPDPQRPVRRVSCTPGSAKAEANVGHAGTKSWFNAHYRPQFPMTEGGRKTVSKGTTWVRLWIITLGKKVSVTWHLDGSNRVTTGQPQ